MNNITTHPNHTVYHNLAIVEGLVCWKTCGSCPCSSWKGLSFQFVHETTKLKKEEKVSYSEVKKRERKEQKLVDVGGGQLFVAGNVTIHNFLFIIITFWEKQRPFDPITRCAAQQFLFPLCTKCNSNSSSMWMCLQNSSGMNSVSNINENIIENIS